MSGEGAGMTSSPDQSGVRSTRERHHAHHHRPLPNRLPIAEGRLVAQGRLVSEGRLVRFSPADIPSLTARRRPGFSRPFFTTPLMDIQAWERPQGWVDMPARLCSVGGRVARFSDRPVRVASNVQAGSASAGPASLSRDTCRPTARARRTRPAASDRRTGGSAGRRRAGCRRRRPACRAACRESAS
jgi:hypothetical protein